MPEHLSHPIFPPWEVQKEKEESQITDKVWGTTEVLLRSSFVELHRLNILTHARCSMHEHKYKWNAFIVISGELTIERMIGNVTIIKKMLPGDFETVGPGELHRFSTGDVPTVALEIYYPEPLSEDIFRRDHGSRDLVP